MFMPIPVRGSSHPANLLRIAILNLFVTLKSRLPNLVVGQLTRESVKSALNKGITANQVITYLTHHAHPQMYKNVRCTSHTGPLAPCHRLGPDPAMGARKEPCCDVYRYVFLLTQAICTPSSPPSTTTSRYATMPRVWVCCNGRVRRSGCYLSLRKDTKVYANLSSDAVCRSYIT